MSRIATLQVEEQERQQELDRLVQQRYRESRRTPLEVLLSTGSVLSALVATDAIGSIAMTCATAALRISCPVSKRRASCRRRS